MATEDEVIGALKTVYDPEIPVNIYDLGLIYHVGIEGGSVTIDMTLTSAHCPAAQSLPDLVRQKVSRLNGVLNTDVNLVWDPPWTQERISLEGRMRLGID
ncbi:MAG: DUF59 domain-containing protein [Candidatus Omnitrophica bacterium]|nr:DUF59 domain-containing protein [Candidatus Omnitrophota bacterium]